MRVISHENYPLTKVSSAHGVFRARTRAAVTRALHSIRAGACVASRFGRYLARHRQPPRGKKKGKEIIATVMAPRDNSDNAGGRIIIVVQGPDRSEEPKAEAPGAASGEGRRDWSFAKGNVGKTNG